MGGCLSSSEPIDFDGPVDFSHFEILRAIGKGAFGKVCIVKKKDSKEMYAMKYMNKIQIIQKKAVDNVYREITILKALEHAFLVNLWFAFQDEEDIFVVIDLMLGGDLSYHLEKEGRFSVERVRLYVAEICLALDYLRNKLIIHRDIKPANMLLDSKGHIHLSDFNVACIVKEGKTISSMTGTKPYMAPEVVRSRSHGYSYSVDWWSLGVSAYEMLRGERPYAIHQNMSNDDMYTMLTRVRPPASARWDEPTCNILKILLHPDPNKRLASLEKARPHSFFSDLDWDKVFNLETTPPYVPSQNRIHCDPTHELEEMIVEPNPLHKKKSRLSKKKDVGDAKLENELAKMNNKFRLYNRLRENIEIAETTHETEDDTSPTENSSSPYISKSGMSQTMATAISLPKQEYEDEDELMKNKTGDGSEDTAGGMEISAEIHMPTNSIVNNRQNSTTSTEPLLALSPGGASETDSPTKNSESNDGPAMILEKVEEEEMTSIEENQPTNEIQAQEQPGNIDGEKEKENPKTSLLISDTRPDEDANES